MSESTVIKLTLKSDKTVDEVLEELIRILPADNYKIERCKAETIVTFPIVRRTPPPKTMDDVVGEVYKKRIEDAIS
jgi:hypothetical protein